MLCPIGKKRQCRLRLRGKAERKIRMRTVWLLSPGLHPDVVVIVIATGFIMPKIYRRCLGGVEFHNKAIGNAFVAHPVSPLSECEAWKWESISVVENKGKPISAPLADPG